MSERKSVFGVAIALIATLAGGGTAYKNYLSLRGIQKSISVHRETEMRVNKITLLVLGTESAQRGYLLTQKASYLKRYNEFSAIEVNEEFTSIINLIADPKEREIVQKTQSLVLQKLTFLQQSLETAQQPDGFNKALTLVKTDKGENLMVQILGNYQLVSGIEDGYLVDLSNKLGEQSRNTADIVALTGVIGFLSIIWSIYLISKAINGQYESQEEVRKKMQSLVEERTLTLKAQVEEQKSINASKGEFIEVLSHEMMTPIAVALGWLNLLKSQEKLPPEKITEGIEVIDRSTRSLSNLIRDILDISKMVQGKISLDRRPVDINVLVESVIQSEQIALQIKQVKLDVVLSSNRNPISADKERLQQVLFNIVSNSIKFTPKGGAIKIRVERTETFAEISVADTGIGISSDFLPYVFDRFKQGKNSSRMYGGLGLGLSIAKQIITLHGGTITANSPGEGQGATFVVRLPASKTYQSPSPSDKVPQLNPSLKTSIVLSNLNILAVDDYQDALDITNFMLTMSGASVIRASSVAEALDQISKKKPDIILSDIGLAVEDGLTLIKKVRALTPEQGGRIPAIALTVYSSIEDTARSLEAGYNIHFSKNIISDDPEQLINAIRNLAGRGRF